MQSFRINEIFYSIQGEGPLTGLPCVFVRLQGCNLHCDWCDTSYAIDSKGPALEMSSEEILNYVSSFECRHVEFTGGEPLMQNNGCELINQFDESGYLTVVETNGSYSIASLNPSVIIVLDIKCPGSAMDKNNDFNNFKYLSSKDAVKFVIASYDDYLWAKEVFNRYKLAEKTQVYFSPVYGSVDAADLALWILKDRLRVKLQLQIHKYIWDAEKRGV